MRACMVVRRAARGGRRRARQASGEGSRRAMSKPATTSSAVRRTAAFLVAIAWMLCAAPPQHARATSTEPVTDPQVDPAPCVAAAAANDADRIIAICSALVARASAYDRQDLIDRAIGDYDTALRLDPTLADIFNARGELWRKKGNRPRALADFGAAIKLNPQHVTARANYRSLALELERIGAQMAIKNRPIPPLK